MISRDKAVFSASMKRHILAYIASFTIITVFLFVFVGIVFGALITMFAFPFALCVFAGSVFFVRYIEKIGIMIAFVIPLVVFALVFLSFRLSSGNGVLTDLTLSHAPYINIDVRFSIASSIYSFVASLLYFTISKLIVRVMR
jgi:hypothetical protein